MPGGGSTLRGRLIAAVPVPFDAAGRVDRAAQGRYVAHMAGKPVDGVAVWAHTGRGLRLSFDQRAEVLRDWRAGLSADRLVIAAAGAPPDANDWSDALARAQAMAHQAAELGAGALLVHPPTLARGRPDEDRLVLEYHDALGRAGLPLVLFYLYEAAGGVSYSAAVLGRLLERPEVVGIKVATLDSVMTYQDVARLVLDRFPEKVLLTGEDRFLGYSLVCGADAALIGMASAWTAPQADLLKSHRDGDAARFLALNARVDAFARATFRAPMEGYVQRMLWCLVHEGVLPASSAHDPWAPPLPPGEFEALGDVLDRLNRE
jgi:4-hydroxy-tetrahydrodipicolinate synthase